MVACCKAKHLVVALEVEIKESAEQEGTYHGVLP